MVDERQRERVVRILAAAAFLIFFQAYMVAPLIPHLAEEFGVTAQRAGLVVPAYLIPYGAATLAYGVLSDRFGRRLLILGSLALLVALTALTATSQSVAQLTTWRLVTGLGASGVVPLALVTIGGLYPFEQRGRPLGWLFGAMAGGSAFGASVGSVLTHCVGWRGLFAGTSALAGLVLMTLLKNRAALGTPPPTGRALPEPRLVVRGFRELLSTRRGARTYAYVLLNATFHSGVFTWLGVYFGDRYGLDEVGIGLALLGYGIPGFLLARIIHDASRQRRRVLSA